MEVEWIGALFAGFPIGVFVGYAWRDSISKKRRLLVAEERRRAEIDAALRAFASPGEATAANPSISDRAPVKAVKQPTVKRARNRAEAPASDDGKPPRQRAKKVNRTVLAGNDPREPEQLGGNADEVR
jgi:hypothetical protein